MGCLMTKPTNWHVFTARMKKAWVLSYPLRAQADRSLRWAHTHFVGFGWFWFDFCFTALQHILGHFERGKLP